MVVSEFLFEPSNELFWHQHFDLLTHYWEGWIVF